ncbi:MAG: endopeptidase La [Gemmatimonadetes bacterium]|nr:endopeptidase La [Gemmatimonadota bacterium]
MKAPARPATTTTTARTGSPRLPVLPLRDVVLFPHIAMPLLIGREGSLAAVSAAADGERDLLLVTQRAADVAVPAARDIYRVAIRARLQQASRGISGATRILVDGLERVRLTRVVRTPLTPDAGANPRRPRRAAGGRRARAATMLEATWVPFPLPDALRASDATRARLRHALALFEDYAGLQRRIPPEVIGLLQGLDDLERLAFGIAGHLQVAIERRQALLEAATLADLADQLVQMLSSELELLKLERKIDEQVRGSLFQNQREFFLQEQLRVIHRELGQEDGDEFDDMERQLAERGLPEVVQTRAQRELRRVRRSAPTSPDAAVARGWLDVVLALPWTQRTDDVIDLEAARAALEADHYGLQEVKERVLDHIAVLGRVGSLPGPILCLVGPPGVGKTSLGRSIAHALGRQFVRMALGGVRDEAEIRGHRRTYIGAMPGRIIQAMRRAGAINPVILLDEVDKLGSDWRGDPASALLEVLDPEQNRAFNDHFLEVDYDLSQVLFITTANSLAGIPEALRDRMEILRIPGYLEPEKLAIATRFLVPKQLAAHGVDAAKVTLANDVLVSIVRGWTREAGVRDLERRIARVARKLARRDAAEAVTVDAAMLPTLLGPPTHDDSDIELRDQVGVASGLAYTSTGGELLEIEVTVLPGRGRLQLTGTLGDVIKESAAAALSFVRARADALGLPADFHRTRDIHVHLPAGATPKDGPSAGIALAVALTSALTGVPVRGDVAMTGEITLRGRVLPIGGVREKGVAAHRHRIAHVIVPQGNARDLAELPAEVKDGVTWHPVRTMDEVLELTLRRDA